VAASSSEGSSPLGERRDYDRLVIRAGDELRVVGGRVLRVDEWIDADVVVDGGAIARIERRAGPADGVTVLDAMGLMVVPGFVDLQINGGFGSDFTSAPETIWSVGSSLPRTGVTAFLPTIVSSPPGTVVRALEVLAAGPPAGYSGAMPLGLHCEGPMLSPTRRGAHSARYLQTPSQDVIDGWRPEAGVRMVTLAPELAGADPVIRELRDRGIVVSIGHSDATFEETLEAFEAGASAGTHLFNAMSGMHHRAPGVAGALLARPDVVAGLIVDGSHVHPGAVAAAWRAKGARGLALVSDAVGAMGTEPGASFRLGESELATDGREVRDRDGTLAGSTLALDAAVRNLVAFAEAAPEEAIAAASATPSSLLEEAGRGLIELGARADLTLLDRSLEIVATMVDGKTAFDRRSERARL
jgi:N-acetylglucosamine-6-phosphate deacetylase